VNENNRDQESGIRSQFVEACGTCLTKMKKKTQYESNDAKPKGT
jgi:hypothetical protein